jgi:hypothetical protein
VSSPVPFAGFGGPGSPASSAASAVRATVARRGGFFGSSGKRHCMCGMYLGSDDHRMPTPELVHEPGLADCAWLRASGLRRPPLVAEFAAAKAAGHKLALLITNQQWYCIIVGAKLGIGCLRLLDNVIFNITAGGGKKRNLRLNFAVTKDAHRHGK